MGLFLTQSITSGLSFSDFFQDANEHRLVFNRILSLGLFNANQQQWDPIVSMVANTLIWAIIGVFFVRLALRHSTLINAPALLVLLLILFSFPLSLVNILWGIQTHTYTMILFSVFGCWYSLYRPLSAKWWFGIASLCAASLTLAGGTFAAFSVAAVHGLCLIIDRDNRRNNMLTLVASMGAGIFGLTMILIQRGTGGAPDALTLNDAFTAFFKAMSWPNSTWVWPAVLLIIPFTLLFIQVVKNRSTPERIVRFTFALFLFVTVVCMAIAYARGVGGEGPARRYFEFMALLPLACALAYMLLNKPTTPLARNALGGLCAVWIGVFILSFPWHTNVVKLTLEERAKLKPVQEKLVRTYLNSKDPTTFENKLYRHVPFPRPQALLKMLDQMNAADTLPYLLQTPTPVEWNPKYSLAQREESAFIVNGTVIETKREFKVNRVGEDVFGSYKPRAGGVRATGRFESQEFRLNRPYAAIPVQGFLGYEGLTMKLVDVGSGEEFDIIPDEISSKYAETWRLLLQPIPRGYYRIVAEDNNPELWFAFATPRSVGRISYHTQNLLNNGHWVWKLGLFLLLISIRNPLINELTKSRGSV